MPGGAGVRTQDGASAWNQCAEEQRSQDRTLRQTRFRIRTLMIVIALTAVGLALTGVVLRWLDIHVHDVYFRFGSPR
jgi:hypothetical protein